ncbi:MAG TPA: amino acid--tRNA ligase-related protein, partial [Methylocystis sp.]|nr:amino acid--tRNA ligase-related protein [Methylocystis sp.]
MTSDAPELSSDPLEARRQKRDLLIAQGLNPYPTSFRRTATAAELAARYKDLPDGEETGDRVVVAGRIYSSRNSGMFMDLHDASGKVQIFSHKDKTPEAARALLPLIDIGDIVGVGGLVRRTKRGELTIDAERVEMLCKALAPMPEKYHGVTDVETKYRRRYLDILVNEESRERFRARSRILTKIRSFMTDEGFLEVETPMLHPIYGGATAEPFVTHHKALDQDMYLRIAPELYLKRVLVSGLADRVFEVNRNFRNEGLSTRHNPEFTMMEAYWAYADFTDAMDLVERLFGALAEMLHGGPALTYGEHTISFQAPFQRISMPGAVLEKTGVDFLAIGDDETAREAARRAGFEIDDNLSWGETLAHVFEETVEDALIQPVHIVD